MDDVAFVVIGTGAAGIQAALRFRELGKEVLLVGRETRAYSLCSLPYVLSGEFPEERIYTYNEEDLRKLGIEPILGREVREIYPSCKKIGLDNGDELGYDGLLIATGSVPFKPPILMEDIPGLYYFNSLDDTRRLSDASKNAKSAAVIGAGFSGLECAYALRKRGLEVSVVEMEDRVLPRILDRDMSPPVEELLAQNGVTVHLRSKVPGFGPKEGRISVQLEGPDKTSSSVIADLVVMCLGVRPDLSLARSAGVRTNRGIVVGPDMQTSVPGIYAAGDVAEFEGQIPATWLTAARQGEVAASNLAGKEAKFTHLDQVNIATLFGVPVLGMGTPQAYLKGAVSNIWKKGEVWRKLITVDGKASGYQSVGSLEIRGLPSLLARELRPVQEIFARAGLGHPALACAPMFGGGNKKILSKSHIRKRG